MLILKRMAQQSQHNLPSRQSLARQKPEIFEKFNKILRSFNIKKTMPTSETSQSIATSANLEKMSTLLKEKDKRIAELLQYEYGAKKAIEQKNWQQEALETEKQQVKSLEKENESQRLALVESRQHALQLERAMQFLQNRIDELIADKTEMTEKSEGLKESLAVISRNNEELNLHSQQLESKLSDEIREKIEFEKEIYALYKQFNVLKDSIESNKQALLSQHKATEDAQDAFRNAERLNHELKASLNACKDDVAGIKQHLTQGLRDAKELENRYAEAVAERVETLKALHQHRREHDRQHLELLDVNERLGASLVREKEERSSFNEKISYLSNFLVKTESKLRLSLSKEEQLLEKLDLAQIENDLHESQISGLEAIKAQLEKDQDAHQGELQHFEEQLHQASQDIALLHNANDQLQQEIIAVTVQSEDKQLQLDEAQQHLAKKVRESALLNEKIEEFLLRDIEARNVHEALQQANTLLQNDLQNKEKKIKEGIEKVSSQEKEILRWEDKWRETNQSRQILEEKIQDLEKIEQRHTQLQNLLLGFGSGSPASVTAGIHDPSQLRSSTPSVLPLETRLKIAEIESTSEQTIRRHPRLQFGVPAEDDVKEEIADVNTGNANQNANAYPNLFDIPQMKTPPKQNLFD